MADKEEAGAASETGGLLQVSWSSEVQSALGGRTLDAADPLLRDYFNVSDLYTQSLETRLASDRGRDEGKFMRLVCQAGDGGDEYAVELARDDAQNGGEGSDTRTLKTFRQTQGVPIQSQERWLWRLTDGLLECKEGGFVLCVGPDLAVSGRKGAARSDDQSWTWTASKQLRHNRSGSVLGMDGEKLVVRREPLPIEARSYRWVVHQQDVQTLHVQLRAKRATKWREGRQRVLHAPQGRFERLAASAREDPRFSVALPAQKLAETHSIVEQAIAEGHGVRNVLLRVQALAESKWEEGFVRQCTRIYSDAATTLLSPHLPSDEEDVETTCATHGDPARHRLHHIATGASNEHITRLEKAGHTGVAAEVAKDHEEDIEVLEAALRRALETGDNCSVERCIALRRAFGRADAGPPALNKIVPECGLDLHRTAAQIAANYAEGDISKEHFPVYADPFTGLPCLGVGVTLTQIEPAPPVGQEDVVDCRNARKVMLGPLPPLGEMWELDWDEGGAADWPALLRGLQQLTGQIAWGTRTHRRATSLTLPSDNGQAVEAGAESNGGAVSASSVVAPKQMCSSSQFSFSIPPSVCSGSAFHIRARFGTNTSLMTNSWKWQTAGATDERGWVNPLTFRSGEYFAPRWHRQTDYFVRADKAEVLPPPPVVLHRAWEAAHIVSLDRDADLREGDLRVYTILGLTPSCDANAGKVLGYGQSRVEVEVTGSNGMTWEEANKEDRLWAWKIGYDVPAEPVGSVLVKTLSDSVRYQGIPAMEAALKGQVAGSGAKKNIKTVKAFVEQLWEKLQPFYALKIEPFLSNHSATYLFVDEMRDRVLREKARHTAALLGATIKDEMQRDRPIIDTIVVKVVSTSGEGEATPGRAVEVLRWNVDTGIVMRTGTRGSSVRRRRRTGGGVKLEARVPSGSHFFVEGTSRKSPWGAVNPHTSPRTRDNVSDQRRFQLWWQVKRANDFTPDELHDPQVMEGGSSLDPGYILPANQLRVGPGHRVCYPVADERGDEACVSRLHFRGVRDGTLYPVHEVDTELVLALSAFEEHAHEEDVVDIQIRITEPDTVSVAEDNTTDEDDQDLEGDDSSEEESSDSWPPLPKSRPPEVGDILAAIPVQLKEAALNMRDSLLRRFGVPEPYGESFQDTPPPAVLQHSFETCMLSVMRRAFARTQLPPGWSPEKKERWITAAPELRPPIVDNEATEAGRNRASSFADSDEPTFVEAVQEMAVEIIKLRLIDTYQKTLQKFTAKQHSVGAERAAAKAASLELNRRLLEPKEEAAQRRCNVDMDALSEADLPTVVALTLKNIIKLEIKDAIQDEVGAIMKPAGAVVVGIVVFIAWYYMYWSRINELGGTSDIEIATQVSQLADIVKRLEHAAAMRQQTCHTLGAG